MNSKKRLGQALLMKCMRGNQMACTRWKKNLKMEEQQQHKKMKRKGFSRVGKVSIDSASLIISDPSYVLHQKKMARDLGRNYQNFVARTQSHNSGLGHQLKHNLGHDGLGVIVYSGGDGTANVYVKADRYGGTKEARIIF